MHRRDFIIKGSIATIFGNSVITSLGWSAPKTPLEIPAVSQPVKNGFLSTVKWMQENGWGNVVKKVANVSMDLSDPLHAGYFASLDLNLDAWEGCDDFAGNKLVEPGNPALSLLYHILASPRVLLSSPDASYPALEHIDMLENFIYALSPVTLDAPDLVLAVFAYEYRPACKTPHESHADLLFSRTGFSRVGTQPMAAYDRKNRCFTNLPDKGDEKEIAVTPARYGLFLARAVPYNEVARGTQINLDVKNNLDFLLPIRKIFKDDICLQGHELFFSESHINEKLRRLCISQGLKLPAVSFDLSKAPFTRVSSSSTRPGADFPGRKYDTGLVKLTPLGSSVLLTSEPAPLAKPAFQEINGKQERLRIWIPPYEKKGGLLSKFENRRYTSFKILGKRKNNIDAYDVLKAKLIWPRRVITDYGAHRNAPMFVYIREVVSENTGEIIKYLNPEHAHLRDEVIKDYWAGLFEDNICDGCILPEITATGTANELTAKLLALPRLPAFSMVTAPDFFPIVESYDMKPYKKLFLLGSVEDMGGGRKRANPYITLPGSKNPAFPQRGTELEEQLEETVVALISHPGKRQNTVSPEQRIAQADQLTRANFLPDCATKIFYPGWDATYSGGLNEEGHQQGTFYATFGLGSPFVEDSKLCAAANGMWAAASPDSARTFRPTLSRIPTSLTKRVLPPTAVPLLDDELGYDEGSPARKDHNKPKSTGWDGEEGPYAYKEGNEVWVNFTDIGRADYVQNALQHKFDMSRLRRITTKEIKARMDALQRCFEKIGKKNTALWLVGAEKVDNWQAGAAGLCLAKSIFGEDMAWITKAGRDMDGYLYLFADTKGDPYALTGSKRMKQECDELYVFQVSKENVACCRLSRQNNWQPKWM